MEIRFELACWHAWPRGPRVSHRPVDAAPLLAMAQQAVNMVVLRCSRNCLSIVDLFVVMLPFGMLWNVPLDMSSTGTILIRVDVIILFH